MINILITALIMAGLCTITWTICYYTVKFQKEEHRYNEERYKNR